MEIKVVGKENDDHKSEGSDAHESDEDDEEFDINKTFMDDPNKIS